VCTTATFDATQFYGNIAAHTGFSDPTIDYNAAYFTDLDAYLNEQEGVLQACSGEDSPPSYCTNSTYMDRLNENINGLKIQRASMGVNITNHLCCASDDERDMCGNRSGSSGGGSSSSGGGHDPSGGGHHH